MSRKLTIIFTFSFIIFIWTKLAYSIECNPLGVPGVCPDGIKNHKCQISKEEGSTQQIKFGKCSETEKIDNNGKKEQVCDCVLELDVIPQNSEENRTEKKDNKDNKICCEYPDGTLGFTNPDYCKETEGNKREDKVCNEDK